MRQKISISLSGENCYNWQGGISYEKYGNDWTQFLRKIIRERDNHICQLCGGQQEDKAFDVHHIDYNKKNNDPNNLITLCKRCHIKTNFNREYWTNYFNNPQFIHENFNFLGGDFSAKSRKSEGCGSGLICKRTSVKRCTNLKDWN